MSAPPYFSDIDLLGYSERVINLDSEIANREPLEDSLFIAGSGVSQYALWRLYNSKIAQQAHASLLR